MEENYINLLNKFKKLDMDDKKEEILKKIYELIQLFYYENKKIDSFNSTLGILKDYNNEEEYLDLLFSYIMSLREESAKLLEKIQNI